MIRITHPVAPSIPYLLDELKAALNIDFNEPNAKLDRALGAAIGRVERHIGQLLYPGTVTLTDAGLYVGLPLPFGPVEGPVGEVDLIDSGFAPDAVVPFTVSYEGYCPYVSADEWPAELRQGVITCAAEGVGEVLPGPSWKSLVSSFRVTSWA